VIFRCGHPWRCLPDDKSHAYWLRMSLLIECPDCIDREMQQDDIRQRMEKQSDDRHRTP